MQNWKDLLVSVYPRYRGPFISARLWLVGRPLLETGIQTPLRRSGSRPASVHVPPLSGHCQAEAALASERLTGPRISSGLYQQSELPKDEAFNEPPETVGGCDHFKY